MQLNKLDDNLLHFAFKKQKDLALTFFRIQEFYESANPALIKKPFDVFTFLNESMDSDGNLDYFSQWSGFNFPGYVYLEWKHDAKLTGMFTSAEKELDRVITSNFDISKPFYIIGTLKDDSAVFRHEVAHALYYLNSGYKLDMDFLVNKLKNDQPKFYKKMSKVLLKKGYNESVLVDELQAYLSTESKKYLHEEFDVAPDAPEHKTCISGFRKIFKKYNIYTNK
jgi:hypothetical protein